MRALLLAVKSRLQTALSLDTNSCDIGIDGMPKPAAGELYVAVVPADWTVRETDAGLWESYGCEVWLTRKVGFCPLDRVGTDLLALATTGLLAKVEAARVAIHGNQTVRVDANTTIGRTDEFIRPLYLLSVGRPEFKGPDWFSAEPNEDGWGQVGVAMQLNFGTAERVQPIHVDMS